MAIGGADAQPPPLNLMSFYHLLKPFFAFQGTPNDQRPFFTPKCLLIVLLPMPLMCACFFRFLLMLIRVRLRAYCKF